MNPDFQMDVVTHDDYALLAVEISFQQQLLCRMLRRADAGAVDIEFVDDRLILESPVHLRFALSDFLEVVEKARAELLALKP
jgi:hypothetical protein